jgi:archaellum component FlaF (FlaF/FlaG flagellin family)
MCKRRESTVLFLLTVLVFLQSNFVSASSSITKIEKVDEASRFGVEKFKNKHVRSVIMNFDKEQFAITNFDKEQFAMKEEREVIMEELFTAFYEQEEESVLALVEENRFHYSAGTLIKFYKDEEKILLSQLEKARSRFADQIK